MKSVLNAQYGGNHYKGLALQPVEIAHKNKLCFRVFSTLKYLFRHDKDGGEKQLDIKKAIHYMQILLEQEYGVTSTIIYSDETSSLKDKVPYTTEFPSMVLNNEHIKKPEVQTFDEQLGYKTVVLHDDEHIKENTKQKNSIDSYF